MAITLPSGKRPYIKIISSSFSWPLLSIGFFLKLYDHYFPRYGTSAPLMKYPVYNTLNDIENAASIKNIEILGVLLQYIGLPIVSLHIRWDFEASIRIGVFLENCIPGYQISSIKEMSGKRGGATEEDSRPKFPKSSQTCNIRSCTILLKNWISQYFQEGKLSRL